MRCTICGAETSSAEEKCSACKQSELSMKVLTPEEKMHFTGVTIDSEPDSDTSGGRSDYQYSDANANSRIYVKQMNFGSKSGFLAKLILFAAIAAILFIALPIAVLLMGIASIVWFIFRRR